MGITKWKILAPLAMTAAGAVVAGIASLTKKPKADAPAASAPSAKKTAVPTPPPAALTTGTYSFISGFKDAATVELSLQYNADALEFDVVGEDFLSYSSASHVAILRGEDFGMQIEYAPYYAGEDFAIFTKGIEQKFQGVAPIRYAALEGVRYRDGDSICLCFPIPGDANSFVQVILF